MGNQAGRLDALERVAPRPTPAVARAGDLSLDDMWRQALILSKSGLVPKELKDNPEGVMLVGMRGAELGWSFTTALDFIDVFERRAVINAQGGLAVIRRAGHRARFVHEECDATKAVIIGQRWERAGWGPEERITWTIEEARTAGLLDEWVERYVKKPGDKWDSREKFVLRREGDGYVPKKFGATTMPDWVKKAIADGQVKHKDNWWNYPGDQLKARVAARLRRNVFSDVMAAYGVDRYTAEEMGADTTTDLDETAEGVNAVRVVEAQAEDEGMDVVDAELDEPEQGEDPGLTPAQMSRSEEIAHLLNVDQIDVTLPGGITIVEDAPIEPEGGDNGGAALVGASTVPLPRLATGPVDWRELAKRHNVTVGGLFIRVRGHIEGQGQPAPAAIEDVTAEQLAEALVALGGPA